MASSLPVDMAESVFHAIQGLPVWQHLGGDYESSASKRAFRATSTTLRHLADGLVTRLTGLHLGQQSHQQSASTDNPSQQFTEEEASWPEEQRRQQEQVKSLLGRLSNLQAAGCSRGEGSLSQLVQLLEEGLLSRVKEFSSCNGSRRRGTTDPPIPTGAIPRGMPLLESLSLELVSGADAQLLVGLSGCTRLHSLTVSADDVPSHILPELASCSSLRNLHLDAPAAHLSFSLLTQLTSLHCSLQQVNMAAVSALTGLRRLELTCLDDMVQPARLSSLTALTRLYLDIEDAESAGQSVCNLVYTLWEDLQAMSQLRELELGAAICELQELWASPSACHHQHLTLLELHLATAALPAWEEGQPSVLPALQQLVVQDDDEKSLNLAPLHFLLHMAPNLQKLSMSASLSLRNQVPSNSDGALTWLCQLAARLAAAPHLLVQDNEPDGPYFGLDAKLGSYGAWPLEADLLPVMQALSPLSSVPDLSLRLDIGTMAQPLMAALRAALPNLCSLELWSLKLPLSALQELVGLQHLRRLAMTKSPLPLEGVAAIHTLEAMQLTELAFRYDTHLGLPLWDHHQTTCTLPHLRKLDILFSGHSTISLQDLHYLLHAAAHLQVFTPRTSCLHILVSSPPGANYSHHQEVQQLQEVVARLAQVGCFMSLALSFEGSHDHQDMAAMFQALHPLDGICLRLELNCPGNFTAAAVRALVFSLPGLEDLVLSNCQLGDPGALACLRDMRWLKNLRLKSVAGPAELALNMFMFKFAAPHVHVTIRGCSWWTSDYQTCAEQGLRAFAKDRRTVV